MRTGWRGYAAAIGIAVASGAARGEPPRDRTPTDAYVRALAGKKLVEGKGFPGLLEIGAPVPTVRPAVGYGREETSLFPFWYFFDKGPWTLTVIGRVDWERCNFLTNIEAIVVEGAGAPPTSRGVKIGDAKARVLAVYGDAPRAFEGPIDHRGATRQNSFAPGHAPDAAARAKREAYDASLRAGLYYPELGMIFAFEDDSVSRIVAIFEMDPLALWLRDRPDAHELYVARIDPAATAPTWEHPAQVAKGKLLLPAVPPLEKAEAGGVSLLVPKGWPREGSTWTAPNGIEHVEVRRYEAAEDVTLEQELGFEIESASIPLLPREQRRVPAAFARRAGADEAFAYHHQVKDGGISGFDRRDYVLLLGKGTRRVRVEVTRTAVDRDPSPDGLELARQVMTSVRIAP